MSEKYEQYNLDLYSKMNRGEKLEKEEVLYLLFFSNIPFEIHVGGEIVYERS